MVKKSQTKVKFVAESKDKLSSERDLRKFSIKDYFILNLIVWAIAVLIIGISYLTTDAGEIVLFLFGVIAVGFTVVSIFDWVYDRLAGPMDDEEEQEST